MPFNIIGSPYDIELKSTTHEDGKRYYITPDDKRYPSITTVLELYNRASLEKWREKVGLAEAKAIGKRAAEQGTRLHNLMESYIKGARSSDLVYEYPLSTVSLFQNLKPIVDVHLDNIHLQEATLYSDVLKVAGRVDCIGEWDGELAVIDFKSSGKLKDESWIEHYFMQASAYAFCYWERVGLLARKIVILISSEKGGPQIFEKRPSEYIQKFREQVKIYYQDMDNPA